MKQRQKIRGSEMQAAVLKKNNRQDNSDEIELTRRTHVEPRTIETEVRPGDTLQALSIRFHCPVAEIKRLNNLHRDNEIHAHRTIKVPFRHFSMVGVHKSGDSSPNASLTKKSVDADILKQRLTTVSSNFTEVVNGFELEPVAGCSHYQMNGTALDLNHIIFNTRIAEKDEESQEEETDEAQIASEEEVQLLPGAQVAEAIPTEFNCNGHDWGISWPTLVTLLVLMAVIVPLVYIFIIVEQHQPKTPHS